MAVYYGDIGCEYFAYQDDIGKGVKDTQVANIKISNLFMEKGLKANPNKLCFILFGGQKYKDKINEQLQANPFTLGGFQVKRRDSDRYLGQVLHTDGVRASVDVRHSPYTKEYTDSKKV